MSRGQTIHHRAAFLRHVRHAAACGVLCLAGTILAIPGRCAADEESAAYFRQLRARGLYTLAESWCRQQLDRDRLAPERRVDLTCELIQTLIEHAGRTTEGDATALWQQAQSAAETFLTAHPDDPRRLLVEAQGAFAVDSFAQWQLARTAGIPVDRETSRAVSAAVEQSVAALRALRAKIQEHAEQHAARRSPAASELQAAELRTLEMQADLRLGASLIELAARLDAADARRAESLGEAQNLLKRLPDQSNGELPDWSARLLLVRSYRLLNDDDRLARHIAAAEKLHPPQAVRDRMLSERISGLLEIRKADLAETLLVERQQQGTALSGELLFLHASILSDRYLAASLRQDHELAQRLDRRLEAAAALCRKEAGDYWAQRCDALQALHRETRRLGPELALLARQAQSQFAEGKVDNALQTYGKAGQHAKAAGLDDVAFQFGFTRASIELQGKRWDDAAIHLKDLAEQFPEHEKSPDAHLLYAYALGRMYEATPTRSAREMYTAALEEHRGRYPDHATFGEATWMLAQFQERRGQFTAALPLYRDIPREHARGWSAAVAVARCCETILQRLRDLEQPLNPWEDASIEELNRLLAPDIAEPAKWTADQSEIAIRLTRILLRKQSPDHAVVDAWLARLATALESAAGRAGLSRDEAQRVAAMRSQTAQLRIMALAGRREYPQARELLESLPETSPEEWLFLLGGLFLLTADDKDDPFHELGELQLEGALALNRQRDRLDEADQRVLDEYLVKAYAAVRKFPQALEIHEKLLEKYPKDKPLLTGYARLLQRCGTRDCLAKAEKTWRKIESQSALGSQEWFVARYEWCRCLFDLKETAEACKQLKYARVVYPELGGPELAAKFAELEVQCRDGKTK
jgi:TolA-binding protein